MTEEGRTTSTVQAPGRRLSFALILPLIALLMIAGATGATPATAGQLESFDLPSDGVDPLKEPGFKDPNRPSNLRVNVLLPDGYDAGKEYPVLYLLHGANGYHQTWAGDLKLAEIAPAFPGIVVMPDGGVFGMYSDWYDGGKFGRAQWMTYHLDTLIDTIEGRYPIKQERSSRSIAGVSMGGMGAVRYAALKPGYFGSVAAISGAALDTQRPESILSVDVAGAGIGEGAGFEDIWGPPQGFYATGNNPQKLIPNLAASRVFLYSGDGTLCPTDPLNTNPGDLALEAFLRIHATAFADEARRQGVDVTQESECGAHSYPTTQRGFIAALKWGIFGAVPEDSHSWTYMTAARHGDANGVLFDFEQPPTELVHFSREGETLKGTGAGNVRIRFGNNCDFNLVLPFETKLANCFIASTPGPGKASLELKRRGRTLLVRGKGASVKNVTVKLFRLRAKPKRKLVMKKKLGSIGTKPRRMKMKLKPAGRYLAVAQGWNAGHAVRKTLRFRTRTAG